MLDITDFVPNVNIEAAKTHNINTLLSNAGKLDKTLGTHIQEKLEEISDR